MTPLDRPVRREVQVEGKAYTIVIDAHGLKFTEKGRRCCARRHVGNSDGPAFVCNHGLRPGLGRG
jgi:hypothetical protein